MPKSSSRSSSQGTVTALPAFSYSIRRRHSRIPSPLNRFIRTLKSVEQRVG